jgi:hypothetical protein
MKIDPEANENRLLSLPCPLALPQTRFSGPNDGLGSVGYLQLGEDVGDVVPHGLRAQVELFGDRGVRVPPGDELKDLALAVGKGGEGLGRGAALR